MTGTVTTTSSWRAYVGTFIVAVALTLAAVAAHPQPEDDLPVIVVLATNGTITELGQLFVAAPQATRLATLRGEQVATTGSHEISDDVRLKLARRVDEVAKLPEVAGVVIAHRADTVEETAAFLTGVVTTSKAVVLTAVMRTEMPPGGDSDRNFHNAVAVAAHKSSAGRGVLVVLDDSILRKQAVVGTVSSGRIEFRWPR